jgi:hypothetical protein
VTKQLQATYGTKQQFTAHKRHLAIELTNSASNAKHKLSPPQAEPTLK